MEENKKQILHGECPTKQNLNMPLLSTRRPFCITTDQTTSNETTKMVPFSWERTPGQPKDNENNLHDIEVLPLPKPPPARWQPPIGIDVSDEDSCGHHERFSDAIDIFSLAESTDEIEFNCRATKDRVSTMLEHSGYHSPSFLIQRFLPDAQALAEESVVNKKLHLMNSPYSFTRDVSFRRSYSSTKGCGLGSFLPWRMKAKPCTVKSPVCDTIIDCEAALCLDPRHGDAIELYRKAQKRANEQST